MSNNKDFGISICAACIRGAKQFAEKYGIEPVLPMFCENIKLPCLAIKPEIMKSAEGQQKLAGLQLLKLGGEMIDPMFIETMETTLNDLEDYVREDLEKSNH